MAEIKSAIELAMERTKSLVMDDKEKKDFAARDVESRVRALLRRFREEMADLDEVRDSFREIGGDEAQKRSILVAVVTTDFDILGKDRQLVELLDRVCSLPEEVRAELKTIRRRYDEDLEKRAMVVRERIREDLKVKGLEGAGMEINLEAWDPWQEEARETKRAFERRIADWRRLVEESCRKGP